MKMLKVYFSTDSLRRLFCCIIGEMVTLRVMIDFDKLRMHVEISWVLIEIREKHYVASKLTEG